MYFSRLEVEFLRFSKDNPNWISCIRTVCMKPLNWNAWPLRFSKFKVLVSLKDTKVGFPYFKGLSPEIYNRTGMWYIDWIPIPYVTCHTLFLWKVRTRQCNRSPNIDFTCMSNKSWQVSLFFPVFWKGLRDAEIITQLVFNFYVLS